jgi:NitT/TauT family transport system substrate-binding protein
MRKLLVPIRSAAVAALTVAALAACGGNSSTTPPASSPGQVDKVNVGVIAIVDVAPIYLGKQKGFFTKHNIDLNLTTAQGGAVIVPGVISGQYQFGFSNITSLVLAKSRNLPIKMVSNGVASTGEVGKDFGGTVVKKDSPIKTAADLAGKTVAVNTLKNIGDTTVRATVRKAGGDPKAVKFVELAFPDMPAALAAGRVDATFVVEPFLTTLVAAGDRVVAWNYAEPTPAMTVAAYFASNELIAKNPDLVKRFQAAMTESLAYADSHPDEVRGVLATYTKITPDIAAKLTLPKWPPAVNKASVQTLTDLAVGDGLIDKAPDLDSLLP